MKMSFFLSRSARRWRRLPWDWRILLVFNGLGLLGVLWRSGLGPLSGPEFMPLGPFIVRWPVGPICLRLMTVLLFAETVGLLLLARWAWALGFAHNVATTAHVLVGFVSGAVYEALRLSGFPLDQEGRWEAVTILYAVVCTLSVGVLTWRVVRRKAFLDACDEPSAPARP